MRCVYAARRMSPPQQTVRKRCGAKNRNSDKPCKMAAGWGTDHPGFGQCRYHAGSTPNGVMSAVKEELTERVVMGVQVDITPQEALLVCVRIAAGEVAYATMKVQELAEEEAVGPVVDRKVRTVRIEQDGEEIELPLEEITYKGASPHIWIQVRGQALDRLARYSKMAIDAGVAERSVALAEETGKAVQEALTKLTHLLDLTPSQRKRVPAALLEVTSTMRTTDAPAQQVT